MNPNNQPTDFGDLSNIALVAIDLDGTLIAPTGQITERCVTGLARAQAVGIVTVVATGRPPMMMGSTTDPIVGCIDYAVGGNGSMVARFPGAELMRMVGFDTAAARAAIETIRAHDRSFGFAYATDAGFIHEPGFMDLMPTSLGGPPGTDVLQLGGTEAYKLFVFHPDFDVTTVIETVQEDLASIRCSDGNGLTVAHMGAGAAEIGPSGLDKANGVGWLCAQLGLESHQVLAIGDDRNDLTLLDWAGVGVAVANADQRVLEIADHIAPSNGDDGVAIVLEALIAANDTMR
jgi:Cof subfamily protein (haloacid dehalogenase superfamily)